MQTKIFPEHPKIHELCTGKFRSYMKRAKENSLIILSMATLAMLTRSCSNTTTKTNPSEVREQDRRLHRLFNKAFKPSDNSENQEEQQQSEK